MICAANLITKGYSAEIEKSVSDTLVCDIFAKKGDGTTIIEIETGFTSSDHALDAVDYYKARIISKIARYSKHCSKFSLATPVIGILPIQKLFLDPPNVRMKMKYLKLNLFVINFTKNLELNLMTF